MWPTSDREKIRGPNSVSYTMSSEIVEFTKVHDDATIPKRFGVAAGFDLYALEDTMVDHTSGVVLVRTGVSVKLPCGTYGRVAGRSGLALRQSLCVAAGVVDVDYRGEIGVLVYIPKPGSSYLITKGERFAQLVVERVSYAAGVEGRRDTESPVVHAGWGSTGQH